jgi:hypothetical protein
MAKLISTAIASLDGYIADEKGSFDWAAPDSDVHAFVNDLERPIGTYLYGRRLYETMVYWETVAGPDHPPSSSTTPSCGGRRKDRVFHDAGLGGERPYRLERTFRRRCRPAAKGIGRP